MNRFIYAFRQPIEITERLKALSDGVFAIIMTLLILEIHLPPGHHETEAEILAALTTITPQVVSWMLSFMILGVLWLNHHNILSFTKKTDTGFVWLNLFFLLCVSFVPFPTALMGEFPDSETIILFFSIVMSIATFAIASLRWYIHKFLTPQDVSVYHVARSFLIGPTLYLAAGLIATINPIYSYLILFFIPIYYSIPKSLRHFK